MKINNFDEELKETLREYVQNTEITTNEKVKFSKKHKQKMEKLFEDVKNSNFEKVATDYTKGNVCQFNVRRVARVAIFIILALLITIAITPSMVAWRKDKLDFYGGESGEYSWILPNDITEVLKNNAQDVTIEELTFFSYLPDNCQVVEKATMENMYHVKLKSDKKYITFRVLLDPNLANDVEDAEVRRLIINENEIFLIEKEGTYSFYWRYDNRNYNFFGELEEKEMIKIIENINYEEIENFF